MKLAPCPCGAVADTPVYRGAVLLYWLCLDCAWDSTPVLTETLPRRIDR